MLLPQPTIDLVEKYGHKFDTDRNTVVVEEAIARLISSFPRNDEFPDVLLKVTAINRLYSTNIYAVVAIAEHIASLNIDAFLVDGDPNAVEQIARIRLKGTVKERRNYSFASKYCSWHNQAAYPIYDSRARSTLWAYKQQDKFHNFSSADLWCENGYRKYREIVDAFRLFYGLEKMSFKTVDKFLYWFDPTSEAKTHPILSEALQM